MVVHKFTRAERIPVFYGNGSGDGRQVTLGDGNGIHRGRCGLEGIATAILYFQGGAGADGSHGNRDVHADGGPGNLLREVHGNAVADAAVKTINHGNTTLVCNFIQIGNPGEVVGTAGENQFAGTGGYIGKRNLEHTHGGFEQIRIGAYFGADERNTHGRKISTRHGVLGRKLKGESILGAAGSDGIRIYGIAGFGISGKIRRADCVKRHIGTGSLGRINVFGGRKRCIGVVNHQLYFITGSPAESSGAGAFHI